MRYDYTAIIPACDEENNIPELVSSLKFLKGKSRFNFEVVIVDDGSKDGTGKVLKELTKDDEWITTIKHPRRLGITKSLETGHEAARSDVFVFFPADLQFEVDDIERLAGPVVNGEYDVVTGKKIGKYEKRFVSNIYNSLGKFLFRIPVKDMNSIKAYNRKSIVSVPLRKEWHRYIVILAYESGAAIGEIDVNLHPRKSGKSKFTAMRIPIGILDLLGVFSEIRIMKKPMLVFGTVGLLSMAFGGVVAFLALVLRLLSHGYRPLLYLVILLVLGGFLSFMLGIVGEKLAGISKQQEMILKRIYKIENKEREYPCGDKSDT
ncbi:glycosyltransferase family 2 protein [candidate division WOR-3 bacterium]|nr:glycosyltransferase family 2 protein [candidate division WOR-3 bacterium]